MLMNSCLLFSATNWPFLSGHSFWDIAICGKKMIKLKKNHYMSDVFDIYFNNSKNNHKRYGYTD